ncbi:MAG: hypothetical protein GY716_22080 [bacterium]|nr:hypothetical protein [bacterium]
MRVLKIAGTAALVLLGAIFVAPPRAEIVEEIVAWVNGDIITKTDMDDEEQGLIAEAYRRFTGDELDEKVNTLRGAVLMDMIERKMLVHYAQRNLDVERMGQRYFDMFKNQQQIESEEQLAAQLARDGLTVDDLKQRFLDLYLPEDVKRYHVGSRVSVGDAAVDAYYRENPDDFRIPAEVNIREIVLLARDDAAKEERRGEAEEVRNRAASGDFAALATEVSEAGTKGDGGALGPLMRGELSKQLEDAAFSLQVGDVSAVMETEYGFHIVKVESRTEDGLTPVEEVREELRVWLEDRRYMEQLEEFMVKVRAESEWCVKRKYRERVPDKYAQQSCASL